MSTGQHERAESWGDLAAGVVLVALSVFAMAHALGLRRPHGWATAPGLLPFLLGASLLVMAGALLAGAVRGGGWRLPAGARASTSPAGLDGHSRWWERPGGWRSLLLLGGLAVYVFLLLRWLPFEIATFVYLVVLLGAMWRRGVVRVALVAAGVTAVLTLLFSQFLRTLLPGAGTLF